MHRLNDQNPGTLRLTVSPYQGTRAALKRMAPWFFTMAFVMLFGVLTGDRLMGSPAGQAFTFGIPSAALIYGAYRTMTLPPPSSLTLEITPRRITITRSDGMSVFQAARRDTQVAQSAYIFRSKYASATFPVLDLKSGEHHARLCVWDPRPEFAFARAAPGKKPHYMIAPSDWEALVSALS